MGWHAVAAVDDAVEAARRFLFPVSVVRWAKLALLVLLMGGGANAGVSVPAAPDARLGGVTESGGIETGTETETGIGAVDAVVADLVGGLPADWLIAAAAVVVGLGVVAFSVASLSLRLVFYDALRTNEIRLWQPFLGRLRQGGGLFVASAVLWSIAAGPIALTALVLVARETPIGWAPIDSFAATVGALSTGPAVAVGLLGGGVVLLGTLALRLTYEFVVPAMVVEEVGVVAGWRRVWRAVSGEWAELFVYLAVHFFVSLGTAIVEGIAFVIAGSAVVVVAGSVLLLAAVPIGGLGALVSTTAGAATVAIVAIIAVVALVALTLPVSVVTRSYLIAYEVATLGGIDPALTLFHADIDPASAVTDSTSTDTGSGSTDRD
ncbi:hypothetical protein DJ69_08945 [Halorubrum persicum]|uniref:Uncharacterized protein n=1 Tax=Halorubrum persicum TaxID=1383844 RepID=A0A2G1WIX0_9EURY|nr:hypothetical protein [Halorubrum persicum]PHQ38930.1 hypothetical protein DJ69_08945 [Halorubrum persicum]